MKKPDDDFERYLDSIEIQTLNSDEIRHKYNKVFDKLEWLEMQPLKGASKAQNKSKYSWNINIIKQVGGRIVGAKEKLKEGAKAILGANDGVELFQRKLAFQSVGIRGELSSSPPSVPEQFIIPIIGGIIKIVLEKRDPALNELKIGIMLLDADNQRITPFLLSIEDMDTGSMFFTDKKIDHAYFNDKIDDGSYRITLSADSVQGSAVLRIISDDQGRE